MTIRVVLADDHPPTRQGVRAALEGAPNILRKLGWVSIEAGDGCSGISPKTCGMTRPALGKSLGRNWVIPAQSPPRIRSNLGWVTN